MCGTMMHDEIVMTGNIAPHNVKSDDLPHNLKVDKEKKKRERKGGTIGGIG